MHVPQSLITANELREIASVPTQIMSPRECKPIISVVQDTALGVYRMTKGHVMMDDKTFFNLMARNTRFVGNLPKPAMVENGVRKWSGRQALSSIIPTNINITAANRSYDENKVGGDKENYVVIENGEIVQGRIDTGIYQNRTKGLVHSIYSECGPDETRQFFDNTQTMVCDYLVNSGFSVGISDMIVDEKAKVELKGVIRDMKVKVYDIIKDIHLGRFENKSIENNNDYFEQNVNQILNQANTKAGKLGMANIDDMTNRMINMVKSGSKGNVINVAQMMACLGQQNVDGKRIVYGFDSRTLPHYTKYDDGPESRGFVENSFVQGLTPQQFFFHAMGGREGLIDTAVKSVTGDTTIIVIENDVPKYVKIGDWIDEHLERAKDEIQHFPEDRNMEFLILKEKVYIPTGDGKGKTSWGELTAVTRHDPGERLYEVTTQSGRKVTVADSESLLVWNEDEKEFKKKHSKDVKVGDYVPVTINLPAPPVITKYVDMKEYFPKTEYIYGTECYKAIKEIANAKKSGRKNLPNGWWQNNNGTLFTLPYKRSGFLEVAMGRENHIIKEGYLYCNGHRTTCTFPDKLELNYENGLFIGIYLAEGSTRNPRQVSISNTDRKIKDFVMNWFDKFNIRNLEENWEGIDEVTGKKKIAESIVGNSTLLASFLDRTCGHGAINKIVPTYAYTAPDEFIEGVLNGYFSGDGNITKHGAVRASSISSKLIEGISMLCSRLGVFGKLTGKKRTKDGKEINTEYCIDISGQWANQFSEQVSLFLDYKNEKMKKINHRNPQRNYPEYNDVAMDTIKSINIIDTSKYPKLYDVTVPSTLNFAISNGLVIVDTSETGYLQRKLVKAMEDCKTAHDGTVRNASGSIVQFLYGEDGMDPTKIEAQPLIYIDMDYPALVKNYLLTPEDDLTYILKEDVIADLKKTKGWDTKMKAHFDQVMADREFMIEEIFEGMKETSILYPVSFMRIINAAKALFGKSSGGRLSDLNPIYVLDTVEQLCEQLHVGGKYNKGNTFMQILLRCYLSPKQMCCVHKFDRIVFDHIVKSVKAKFYDSINDPSEMVGVVAAQSIGEPSTQLVLNSVHFDTDILFRVNGELVKKKIGEFIDTHIEKCDNSDIEDHPNDTKLAWIKDKEVHVLACDKAGKVEWQRVEAVTRHPVINKDGTNTLLKITTQSGREVVCTKAKSLLMKVNNEIIPVDGENLKVGDLVPVSKILPVEVNANSSLILDADDETVKKYVAEFFKNQNQNVQEDVRQVLLRYNINSIVTNNKLVIDHSCYDTFKTIFEIETDYVDIEHVVPFTTKQYGDVVVSKTSLDSFLAMCSHQTDKDVVTKIHTEDVLYDKIIKIEEIPNDKPWVYDLTVENTRTFNAYNGICCDDTFHSSGISSASKAVRGVPRIKELLSVSKNPKAPSLKIYLSPEVSQHKNMAKDVMNTIQTTYFADIVTSSKIYFDPDDFNTTIDSDREFIKTYKEFIDNKLMPAITNNSPWLLRFELDKAKMLDYNITVMDIHMVMQEQYDESVSAMFSDDNASQIIFRIKLNTPEPTKKGSKAAAVAADDDEATEKDYVAELKALEKSMLENLIIKGIKKINKAAMNKQEYMKYNKETMKFEKSHEWVIETAGTNLVDILRHKQIDPYRTVSNDIIEIYQIFGIEAARQALYQELNSVIKDGDLYINYRHIALLVDTMTNRGYLMSIDRHGINRVDVGPLAKCSFEEVTDMLTKAGVFAEIDRISGISANVMLGQIPQCGTGDTQILLDESKLMATAEDDTFELKMDDKEMNVPTQEEADTICTLENLTFDFTVPNADKSIKKIVTPQIKLV